MFTDHHVVRSIVPAIAMFFCSLLSVPTRAQDLHTPTLAEYNALKAQIAMARANQELQDVKDGKAGDGQGSQRSGAGQAGAGSYVTSPTAQQSVRETASDPMVLYVKPSARGLVAVLSRGHGESFEATAGRSIGRGATVVSVTVSEVTVRDGSGVHALSWGDGSDNGGAPSNAMQAITPPPGVMTTFPVPRN